MHLNILLTSANLYAHFPCFQAGTFTALSLRSRLWMCVNKIWIGQPLPVQRTTF